ncbi:hypothetical protein FSP39_009093 [Pinctada imbricata]|uniref:Cyclic GMP-AMP synthase n=1 Tax=Pinctada imbricata TaxID=66713 RepID=A0AA89BSS2_PINIB|nr:hypothetical protein FSP39_009093 [Pinctada imbricata]
MDFSPRLSYLFGTEEYVVMRRQLALLRETMINHLYRMEERNLYTICSGSLGEGVAYPKSDDDVMICETDQRVVMTYREATQRGDVLMVPSEYSPGYCLLLDVKGSHQETCTQIIDEKPFLSSSAYKQFFLRSVGQSAHIHGPCISGIFGSAEGDLARCISCSSWPDVATEWLTRNRLYNWPSTEMSHNIVQKGCHVVPVGDPDSPYCNHEWRISFSVAERTLMHSFNHTQFLVYNLLRLTLKRIIEKSFPDVLCSYFMKTTLFHSAEKTPKDFWREGHLESCFRTCLSVLYDYVDNIYCPNYFIPGYNMIKRKINHTNRREMLDIIKTIHNIGIVGTLQLSGESHCLDATLSAKVMEYKLDTEFMFSAHLRKAFIYIEDVFLSLPHEAVVSYTDCLSTFFRMLSECTQNELGNMIRYRGINSYCLRMMHSLFSLPKNNKHKYRLYETLKPMLTTGFRGDVTTGKLTMATYMYMVGKTESALYVIQKLLSDYPPYAMDGSRDELKMITYIDYMCGRGYSIEYKARRAYVPYYRLYSRCLNAFPHSLKILISKSNYILIDPLTYTYFLQSLCYVQLRDLFLLKKSTKCLINRIDDLKGDMAIAHTRMCVGIIKYVQGEPQSACRWLRSVYIIAAKLPRPFNEEFSSSVLTYMSCLLNKYFSSDILTESNSIIYQR